MIRQLLRSILRNLPERTSVPVLSGPLRGTRLLLRSGTAGYWLGTYEPEMQRLLHRLLAPGQVFYDVGAHAGFHTLLASRLVGPTGHVVAFEPHPVNATNLRRHVALNLIRNIAIVEAAVSDHSGLGSLEGGENLFVAHLSPHGRIQVNVISLDNYVAQGNPRPDLIKIDTEGGEGDVLIGAERLCRAVHPTIIVSIHSVSAMSPIAERLTQWGYRITDIHALNRPEAACFLAQL